MAYQGIARQIKTDIDVHQCVSRHILAYEGIKASRHQGIKASRHQGKRKKKEKRKKRKKGIKALTHKGIMINVSISRHV